MPTPPGNDLPIPLELRAALDRAPEAAKAFEDLSPSCRREYLEWIGSAKRPETRERRIGQAVEMIAAGPDRICRRLQERKLVGIGRSILEPPRFLRPERVGCD